MSFVAELKKFTTELFDKLDHKFWVPLVINENKFVACVVVDEFIFIVAAKNVSVLAIETALLNKLVPVHVLLVVNKFAPETALSTYNLFVNSVFIVGTTEHIGAELNVFIPEIDCDVEIST